MGIEEFEERMTRILSSMKEKGYDCLILLSPPRARDNEEAGNVRDVSEILPLTRPSALVLPIDRRAVSLVPQIVQKR